MTDDGARIEDLGSHNGTFVNAKRIGSARLRDNDLINVAATSWSSWRPREYDDHGAAWLLAQDVDVAIEGRRILENCQLPSRPE